MKLGRRTGAASPAFESKTLKPNHIQGMLGLPYEILAQKYREAVV